MKHDAKVGIVFNATRRFLDKVRQGGTGTINWPEIELCLPSYEIKESELQQSTSTKIGYVRVPRRLITLSINMSVKRNKSRRRK